MEVDSVSRPVEEGEEGEEGAVVWEEGKLVDGPAHHPSAPADELFDLSTTVDPSYIISLIRKLLPANPSHMSKSHYPTSGNEHDIMVSVETADMFLNPPNEGEDDSSKLEQRGMSVDEVWEEYGCILWDLAASKTPAELMVQNLILEVLSANLSVSPSVRAVEICLGIIGNLSCHEIPMNHIVSANGLIGIVVAQLFLEDAQCLCEVFRLLTVALQSSESNTWVRGLQSDHIISRILWVCENTLNLALIEKSVGLLLAILESPKGITHILPSMIKLGLPNILINLLAFEMSKLTSERAPERYLILDVMLRAIEAFSTLDEYSQEICSSKELFKLLCDLVKLPEKVEVASSFITAVVLIANILADSPDLAFEILFDFYFFQGLLDIFSLISGDLEACNAVWSIIARILIRVQEKEMSNSNLFQYVLLLASKTGLIEEDLVDQQLNCTSKELNGSVSACTKSNSRTISIRKIIGILNQLTAAKFDNVEEIANEYHVKNVDLDRLLDCCCRYSQNNLLKQSAENCFGKTSIIDQILQEKRKSITTTQPDTIDADLSFSCNHCHFVLDHSLPEEAAEAKFAEVWWWVRSETQVSQL